MCIRIYVEDIDMVKIFINQWNGSLLELEKEILKLECHSEDLELLLKVCELTHNIKSGASFVGLPTIIRISDEIQNTLDAIKSLRVTLDTELIDVILACVDFLKFYIKRLMETVKEENYNNENDKMYLEISNKDKGNQALKSLKIAFENCKISGNQNNNNEEEFTQGEVGLEILQSEEFNKGLSEGIKEQFIIENTEHIDRIENDLLVRLDANSHDKDAIAEVFRAIHSIKGGIGIYLSVVSSQSELYEYLKKFSEVVHTFESLLALIRDKEFKFEKNLVDLSYLVMDYLQSGFSSIEAEDLKDLGELELFHKIKLQIANFEILARTVEPSNKVTTAIKDVKVEETKSKVGISQSIRVNQEKIDKMMNMISELLIAKNSFMHISEKLNLEYDIPEMSKEVKQVGAYVNRISDELQNTIMSIRMVEVKTVFQKMPRVIRDIAQSTGKKMELSMEGENTEIDKTIIEQISDPLVHLIRNSADHGIESSEERLERGKPEIGTITLRAYNKNKHVFIEIEDDGKGIDAEGLKKKAIEKGMITEKEAEKMNKTQLINLIFLPGFSMAQKITEVSGRGVGMDIVKSNISKINGKITIESEVAKGTKMTIQLPLTLAVSRGLIVEVQRETYIFPLEYIVENVKINRKNIHEFNGKLFIYLRGEAIGLEWLCKIFLTGDRDNEKEELNVVILSDGTENYAIVVDKLKNEQEFVVKPLEGHLAAIPGISGSTLLGNGKVVLIVNPMDIFQLVAE